MQKFLTFTAISLLALNLNAQQSKPAKDESWKKVYRAAATKTNNLVHTKLHAKFDYENSYLLGKVWLTLKPHFYATSTVELDAKGMEIKSVEMFKAGKLTALSYNYDDGMILKVNLDKEYKANEPYTLYIDYIAKPDELKAEGSAAIKDAKGLYFINPKGEDKNKPTQIWTQGETEATSVWVPTIDRTNQKSTQEFYLTVPNKYVTLSNGKLMKQTKNTDGTRTDYWKMDLPHAPYLFFMGVGEYSIVKDTYKGKEVNYYVEKEYEKVARKIFGYTPEMMKFFSEKVTGIEFPWNKYSQIVGRDYVSGAMENTTATLHQESAYQNARQLQDGNGWETTVAHELFHQWFGDYVTAESWSNLTVNESFADYSEYLWTEYKYGDDAAGEEHENALRAYLNRKTESKKDLVRFYYNDKEDMFDLVSYQKGGRILNMLRYLVGDSAFFKSLNRYLTDNKFGTGSAHKLRIAFESVTGKDLNWFFNQWYFGNSHPKLNVKYSYDAANRKAKVWVEQTQEGDKIFNLSAAVDLYNGKNKTRHFVWIENKIDSFEFDADVEPSLINFDGDRVLLCERKENKTDKNYLAQYSYSPKYADRRDAIDYAIKNKNTAIGMEILKMALNDKYYKLRSKAINALADTTVDAATIAVIENIANRDAKKLTKADAISFLANLKDKKYASLFNEAVKDSSYTVAGAGLQGLMYVDETSALKLLPELKKDMKGDLKSAVGKCEILTKGDADFDEVTKNFNEAGPMEKFEAIDNYLFYLGRVTYTDNFKKGVDEIINFRNAVAMFGARVKDGINKELLGLKAKKLASSNASNEAAIKEQAEYIDEKLKD